MGSLSLVPIRKLVHVILSEAKNLCGPANYEILRRPDPAGLLRMTPKNTVSGRKLMRNEKWKITNVRCEMRNEQMLLLLNYYPVFFSGLLHIDVYHLV